MPTAFTKVFNKHPRMRSLMSKDTPFTAVIQDYVTIDDVLPLISAVNVVGDEWKQMVELECNVPFKRDIQLPYFIRIYKQDERNAKMVIYADHYMSDGTSAFIIINDILTSVCNPNADLPEQKLTDSIYAMKCSPIRRWCEKTLMKCLRPLISHRTKSYQPLFPIDKSQGDYSVPIPRNPSGALFADGSAENMKSAIQNCKKHSVSVNSAVMVALLIAAVKTKFDEDTSKCNNFKMALDCAYDLRRGSPKTKDLQVGAFANSTVLLGYKSKGVDLDKNFWSECTRAKKETIKAYGLLTLTSAWY
ncbi:hypothetical protein HDV02_001946 [Globomyces sp. JEL0801]|nr:hypothetical protein HDV02_001946 [Globomyces sp. JEL0801]